MHGPTYIGAGARTASQAKQTRRNRRNGHVHRYISHSPIVAAVFVATHHALVRAAEIIKVGAGAASACS